MKHIIKRCIVVFLWPFAIVGLVIAVPIVQSLEATEVKEELKEQLHHTQQQIEQLKIELDTMNLNRKSAENRLATCRDQNRTILKEIESDELFDEVERALKLRNR